MKMNPKSVRDSNETIEWKDSLKCALYLRNHRMKKILKSARNTNLTIEWKIILKMRETLTW